MNPAIGLAIVVAAAVTWLVVMPWARRFDARKADERQAAGKSRSATPPWVVVALAVGMILAGSMLRATR